MATNYVVDGGTVGFIGPKGGAFGGIPLAIGDLVVVPLEDTPEGVQGVGYTKGVWNVPAAAGLKFGQKVAVLDSQLVAPETDKAVYCGKLMSEVVGGYADLLLIQ